MGNLPVLISYPSEWGFGAEGDLNWTADVLEACAVHSTGGVKSGGRVSPSEGSVGGRNALVCLVRIAVSWRELGRVSPLRP